MKWNRLKNNKCPKCLGFLTFDDESQCHVCNDCQEFVIGKEKFDRIVNDMYHGKKFIDGDTRLEDWNNDGLEEVTEDFSDSRFLDG